MNVRRSLLDEVLPRFDASEVHAAPLKQVTVGEIRLVKPLEAMRARGRPLRAALSFRTVAASASLRAMRASSQERAAFSAAQHCPTSIGTKSSD
jgi:hypothetical protein